ncbi:MAG TPA: hypothetical protein VFY97_01550 [Rhodanobacteraceae bacterium]|nr:hypothetical protein [Rhodanobacteraceae bacterium]
METSKTRKPRPGPARRDSQAATVEANKRGARAASQRSAQHAAGETASPWTCPKCHGRRVLRRDRRDPRGSGDK